MTSHDTPAHIMGLPLLSLLSTASQSRVAHSHNSALATLRSAGDPRTLTRRLTSLRVPCIPLGRYVGAPLSPTELRGDWLACYFYPGIRTAPESGETPGGDDALHRAFCDNANS